VLRRAGLSAAAIAAIFVAAVLLFGSPTPSPTATPVATSRPPTALETPSATPGRPYAVVSGGELQGASLITDAFGWVRTGDGYRVTVDGGLIWQSAPWPDLSDRPVFTDGADGWVFGQVGGLYHTTDGGATWSSVAVPGGPYQDIGSPTFTDPSSGTLVGQEVSSTGAVVLATADGGATWTRHPIAWPGLGDAGALRMFDARHGLVLMASRLTPIGPTFDETSDGGRTWHALVLPRPAAVPAFDVAGGQLWAGPPVRIASATTAVTWQVYTDPSGASPGWVAFFITSDAGRTWRQAGPIVPGGTVAALSARHWLVISPDGVRAETTDGGTTWTTAVAAGLTLPVRWLQFPTDDGRGWAGVGQSTVMCAGPDGCGPDGLEATSDGGLTWRSLAP
jgi:photosystem II stability/assembly factor-like uncharacterized protein